MGGTHQEQTSLPGGLGGHAGAHPPLGLSTVCFGSGSAVTAQAWRGH